MIKNEHIIHMLDKARLESGDARYLCTQSCYPTFEKSTTNIKKVTCRNCLRLAKIFEFENLK